MACKLAVLILFMCVSMLQCRVDRIAKSEPSGTCTFKGYVPGGKKVTVQRITAPIATLQEDIMSACLGKSKQAAGMAMHTLNALKAFGTLSKSFASIAPALGPCLGIFGVVLGGLTELTKPKPADILKATNVAIAKLTDEVNDRMEEMKGYVDQKVIDLEKSLIGREYKTLFILWANCINERTYELTNECQRDAAKSIIAAKPKFLTTVNGNDDVYNVKRLEATFTSFRDYAVLSVMCLKSLVDTYATNANTTDEARFYYDRYSGELKAEVNSFVEYAERSVKTMVAMHVGNEFGSCSRTYKCNGMHQIKEGFWNGVNTADSTDCTCVFDPADVATRTCKYSIKVRVDGAAVGSPYVMVASFDPAVTTYYSAAQAYGNSLLLSKARNYLRDMRDTITKYWHNEVLDLIPSWKDVAGIPYEPSLASVDVSSLSPEELYRLLSSNNADASNVLNSNRYSDYVDYSPSFRSRLAIASEMASDFNSNDYNNANYASLRHEQDYSQYIQDRKHFNRFPNDEYRNSEYTDYDDSNSNQHRDDPFETKDQRSSFRFNDAPYRNARKEDRPYNDDSYAGYQGQY